MRQYFRDLFFSRAAVSRPQGARLRRHQSGGGNRARSFVFDSVHDRATSQDDLFEGEELEAAGEAFRDATLDPLCTATGETLDTCAGKTLYAQPLLQHSLLSGVRISSM